MPRYYYHIDDGQCRLDLEGVDLKSHSEARYQAVTAAGSMLKDHYTFWENSEWRMLVEDENGNTVCLLRFAAEMHDR